MNSIQEVKSALQIKKVEEMAIRIWNEHYTPIIGKAQVDYMLKRFQSAEAIKRQIAEGYRYFFILSEGKVAGYFAILPGYPDAASMFLSKLYVEKAFRRRGLARRSVSYIEKMCKDAGITRLWLTVNKNNTGSIKAYEKMGFVNVGSIVQDIGGGFVMDDYRMEKRL